MEAAELLVKAAMMLYVAAALVAAGILAGWPSAQWLGERMAKLLSGLPDEKYETAPPRLAMAEAMARHGDLEGALEFYETLQIQYPQEPQVYQRMLEIALGPLDRPELAEKILVMGWQSLTNGHERDVLARLHADLASGSYRPLAHLWRKGDPRGGISPTPPNQPVPPVPRRV